MVLFTYIWVNTWLEIKFLQYKPFIFNNKKPHYVPLCSIFLYPFIFNLNHKKRPKNIFAIIISTIGYLDCFRRQMNLHCVTAVSKLSKETVRRILLNTDMTKISPSGLIFCISPKWISFQKITNFLMKSI